MEKERLTVLFTLLALFVLCPAKSIAQNNPPTADAGLSRYAAEDAVVLDGTSSYDPEGLGQLSYSWQQIAGPSVVIMGANTATPTISGFIQTDEVQECEFELVVSDGELTSPVDTVKVIIVPDFGTDTLWEVNPPFDCNKPTLIYFGGGNCVTGGGLWPKTAWAEKANIIASFPDYGPDPSSGGLRTYYRYGDMIIVYLSSVAPDYKQPIQTSGWSTGGQPAIDVGIRLNLTYVDARYALNRITFFDATPFCREYSESITAFLASAVDGEQCWIDSYVSNWANVSGIYPNVLNVGFEISQHSLPRDWFWDSLTGSDMNKFNNGVVAGAYWSVGGPGKNLQLASTPDVETYKFTWYGDASSGYMDFYDEPNRPGKLPEPVTLVGPIDVGDPNGAVLTCEESENAVGYQLLFGSDPYRVMDYNIFSDTTAPPNEVITKLPFDVGWWTVRVYDQYGSTIYADPIYIGVSNLSFPVENLITGKKYSYLQDAINDAAPGDEIVVKEGIHHENINFQGKNLTVRSTEPNNSAVVAATIFTGDGNGNLMTFSDNEDAGCVLSGFMITDANNGIYCSGSSPTITKCSIVSNVNAGIKLYMGSNPTVSNCIIAGNGNLGVAMIKFSAGRKELYNSPTIVNCTIVDNSEIGISKGIPTVLNSIIYGNGVQIAGSSVVVTYSNVQGGFHGEGNIDSDPLFADTANGDYHLKSQAGRWEPASQSWVIDEVSSPCIDAGDPITPVGSEPLNNGCIINMGAYGGTAEASKSPGN